MAQYIRRWWKRELLLSYLVLVVWVIIFKYPLDELLLIAENWRKDVVLEGLHTANFTFFRTIKMYIRYYDRLNSFENLVGNVAVFVPFGFMLPWAEEPFRKRWKVLLNAFVFVAGIEVFQLISAFGVFDVDDILLNCLGAMLGYAFFQIWVKIRPGGYGGLG